MEASTDREVDPCCGLLRTAEMKEGASRPLLWYSGWCELLHSLLHLFHGALSSSSGAVNCGLHSSGGSGSSGLSFSSGSSGGSFSLSGSFGSLLFHGLSVAASAGNEQGRHGGEQGELLDHRGCVCRLDQLAGIAAAALSAAAAAAAAASAAAAAAASSAMRMLSAVAMAARLSAVAWAFASISACDGPQATTKAAIAATRAIFLNTVVMFW